VEAYGKRGPLGDRFPKTGVTQKVGGGGRIFATSGTTLLKRGPAYVEQKK